MLKRTLLVVLIVLMSVLLLAGLTWYLAFSAGPKAPAMVEIPGIQDSVTVTWSEDGPLNIEAASEADAWVGLGYGMARTRAWQLALWRQVAIGQLSSWMGEDAISSDRLALQLRFAEEAKLDITLLPEGAKASLTHLTEGINAALTAPDMARDAPFLLLGIQPEPWEAWHSIAVERLFNWIAGNPFAPEDSSQTALADRDMREILHIDGFEYNMITAAQRDSVSFISARFATGRTAVPFFIETQITTPERTFIGLFVPGSFMAPLGSVSSDVASGSFAWGFLLSGDASVHLEEISSAALQTDYSRVESPEKEELVFIVRSDSTMPLIDSVRDVGSRPTPVLRWSGLYARSDVPHWLNLLSGTFDTPAMVRPDGIVMQGSSHTILGSPTVVDTPANGMFFISNSFQDRTPQDRLHALEGRIGLVNLLNDAFSRAAEDTVAAYLAFLPDSALTYDLLQQGIPYLTNWNYEYDAPEIGASMFELIQNNELKADSTLPAQVSALFRTMTAQFGSDMSAWRWENVHDRTLFFPGTTARVPDGGRPEASFNSHFSPIDIGGPGHPQTFVWGSAIQANDIVFSSAWEGGLELRSQPSPTQDLIYRRPFIDFETFLGSFLTSDRPIEIAWLSRQRLEYATELIPAIRNE